MIVKLSDFVLEQSISDASVNDIALEQYQAEYNVADAMANAYMKSMNLIYVYEAEGQTVTTEAKKDNIFKRIWAAIVKAWKAICEWFKARWEGIKRLFGKGGKVAATANAVANSVTDMPQEDVDKLIEPTSELCFQIGRVLIAGDILSEEFIPLIDEVVEYFDSNKETDRSKLTEFDKKCDEILAKTDSIMKTTRPGKTDLEAISGPDAAVAERYINMGAMFINNKSMTKEQYADIIKKLSDDIDAKIKNITTNLTAKLDKALNNLSKIDVKRFESTGTDENGWKSITTPTGFATYSADNPTELSNKTKRQYGAIQGDDRKNITANVGALGQIKNKISKAAADIQSVVNTAVTAINEACDKHFEKIKEYKEKQKKQGKNPTTLTNLQGNTDKHYEPPTDTKAKLTDKGELPKEVADWYDRHKDEIGNYSNADILAMYNNPEKRKIFGESYYYIQ